MLKKTFRYAVSNWVVSNKKNNIPHVISQEEINFLLLHILNSIEQNTNYEIDWIIQKNKNEEPKKMDVKTISYLKIVALSEMKYLILKSTEVKIPEEFLKDELYFSKIHNNLISYND